METRNASQHHCCLLKLWLGFTAMADTEEKLPKHPQAAHPTGKRRGRSDSAQGESAAQVGTWDKADPPCSGHRTQLCGLSWRQPQWGESPLSERAAGRAGLHTAARWDGPQGCPCHGTPHRGVLRHWEAPSPPTPSTLWPQLRPIPAAGFPGAVASLTASLPPPPTPCPAFPAGLPRECSAPTGGVGMGTNPLQGPRSAQTLANLPSASLGSVQCCYRDAVSSVTSGVSDPLGSGAVVGGHSLGHCRSQV